MSHAIFLSGPEEISLEECWPGLADLPSETADCLESQKHEAGVGWGGGSQAMADSNTPPPFILMGQKKSQTDQLAVELT